MWTARAPGGGWSPLSCWRPSAGSGSGSSVVMLPAIEADFGLDRGGASLPYFATMLGLATGGTLIGAGSPIVSA